MDRVRRIVILMVFLLISLLAQALLIPSVAGLVSGLAIAVTYAAVGSRYALFVLIASVTAVLYSGIILREENAIDLIVRVLLVSVLPVLTGWLMEMKSRVEMENRFSATVLASIGSLVMVLDTSGRIVKFNAACEKATLYKASEVVGRSVAELFLPPRARPKAKRVFDNLIADATNSQYESEWICRDGRRIVVSWRNTAMVDRLGQVEYVIASGVDVTDVRAAAFSLEAERQRLEVTLHSIADAVITTDAEGLVTLVNPVAEEITGWRQAEATGRHISEIFVVINAKTGESLGDLVSGAVDSRTIPDFSDHVALISKTGSQHRIAANGAPIGAGSGEAKGVVIVFRDVTESQRVQEQLRILGFTLDNSSVPTFLMDRGGKLLRVNRAASASLGYTMDELLKLTMFDVSPLFSESSLEDLLEDPTSPGSLELESELVTNTGFRFPVEMVINSVDYEGDLYAIAFATDVSERVRAEQALHQQLEFEELVANLSSGFINLPEEDMDKGIDNALRLLGIFADVDRSYILENCPDANGLRCTHEWCAKGVTPDLPRLKSIDPKRDIPSFMDRVEREGLVYIPSPETYTGASPRERSILMGGGIKSLLVVGICIDGGIYGLVGFDSVTRERAFTSDVVALMEIAGSLFANVFHRRHTLQRLRRSEERFRLLAQNAKDIVFRYNLGDAPGFDYLGPSIKDILGLDANAVCEDPELLLERVHHDDVESVLGVLEDAGLSTRRESFRAKGNDGRTVWLELHVHSVEDEDGVAAIEGIARDVSERKAGEEALQFAYEELEQILGTVGGGVCVIDTTYRIVRANKAFQTMFETRESEVIGRSCRELLENDACGTEDCPMKLMEKGESEVHREFAPKKDRSSLPSRCFALTATPFRDPEGGIAGVVQHFADITGLKEREERIRYLSYHDRLTGLYNRAYFDDALAKHDKERYLPLSIVMGDANGLKLANDAFGHQVGDALLVKIAKILSRVSRDRDTICRWGGDEFIMLMPNTDENEAARVCQRISLLCEASNSDPVQPSIALGSATKVRSEDDIKDALRDAETRMYNRKLMDSRSVRNSIILSLKETLDAKTHETNEHASRMQYLATRLGRVAGLSRSSIDDLDLLSVLHDIGKVGIKDEILIKPGPLTDEEWQMIRRHPEIGHRITSSSVELSHIADAILSHHEWWDGSGYPRALSGQEIPLLSRIISIVDAFDVMTHERAYKPAISSEEALAEIQRCAGSQFDPELADLFAAMVRDMESDWEQQAIR